jgi:hypothetical protein
LLHPRYWVGRLHLIFALWLLLWAIGVTGIRQAKSLQKAAGRQACSWLFEIALVFVRLDHVASRFVRSNHFVIAMQSAKEAESAA